MQTQILRKLGLREYEIRAIVQLAKENTTTAAALAKKCDIPRTKMYEVLYDLVEQGIVMQLPVSPKQFRIASLEKLKDRAEQKRQEAEQTEKQTHQLIKQLTSFIQQPAPEPVWVIKGQQQIVDKIRHAIQCAQQETVGCARSLVDSGALLRDSAQAVQRGVKVRMICEITQKNERKVEKYRKAGIQIRAYKKELFGPHGTRFSIFDDNACRITIGKPEILQAQQYTTIWSESPSFVRLMKQRFEDMWKQCKDN